MLLIKRMLIILFISPICVKSQGINTTYANLLNDYRHGIKDYLQMPRLAELSLSNKDTATAKIVAAEYFKEYLSKLKQEHFTTDQIRFIAEFTNSPDDTYFDLFYQRTGLVNHQVNKMTFAQNVVSKVLIRSEIEPIVQKLPKGQDPDWAGIKTKLLGKYNALSSDRAVAKAKVDFYQREMDWKRYAKALREFTSIYADFADINSLDHDANVILTYSSDPNDLTAASNWSKWAIERDSANKTYKKTLTAIQTKIKELKSPYK